MSGSLLALGAQIEPLSRYDPVEFNGGRDSKIDDVIVWVVVASGDRPRSRNNDSPVSDGDEPNRRV